MNRIQPRTACLGMLLGAAAAALSAVPTPVAAQQSQVVVIPRGKTQTTLLGSIKGNAYRD